VVDRPDAALTPRHAHRVACRLLATLARHLDFPRGEQTVHVFTIVKPAPVPAGDGAYRYGFHVLVPGVWVARGYKKYLIRELAGDAAIGAVLADLGTTGGDGLDAGSASVPVLYLGSCKRGGRPYGLGPAFEVAFDAGAGADFYPMVRALGEADLADYNLVAELSLCTVARYGDGRAPLVPARTLACRAALAAQVEDLARRARDAVLDPGELLLAEHSLSTLALHNPEARFLHQVLDLLDESYAADRNRWRDVIFALANTSETFYPLAEWFSQKCPEKWADGGRASLEQMWEDALVRRGNVEAPLTRRSLMRWARECNPERYRQVAERNYFGILANYVYDHGGVLEHYMVAKVLHAMLGTKFVVDIDEGHRGRYTYCWFEFVIPGQTARPGEVWKWRKEVEPDELQTYVSEKLVGVFDQVAEHIEEQRAGADDEEKAKYYRKLGATFAVSRRKIFNDTFKNGVIRQAHYLFRRRGFVETLDRDPRILGVGNGLLRLGPACELVDHFHEHPVMLFTPVVYRPFDPADPWTRLMLDAVADIVPEPDVRDWLMFFAAGALAGGVKEGILLLWNGGGANGKTFFMRMVAKALGPHYAKKLNISLLTSERESADKPNSAMMQLKGCRWGYVEETQKSEPLNSQRLKEIVNPGEVSGRDLNQKQETFEITANLAVGQNYDFVIDTTDHGTWRRLRHYRSKVKFCADPDPANPFEKKDDQRFVREYINDPACQTAFLGILVHYYERLQREHGGELKRVPCPTLDAETTVFRNCQDTTNRFITEAIVVSPAGRREYPLAALAQRYITWHTANISNVSHNAAEVMQDLENSALQKYIRHAPNNTRVLVGCRVLVEGATDLDPEESFFGGRPAPLRARVHAPTPAAGAWWDPPPPGAAPPPRCESPPLFGGGGDPRPAPPPAAAEAADDDLRDVDIEWIFLDTEEKITYTVDDLTEDAFD
jgi:phage/plasmid-associated DNA primase